MTRPSEQHAVLLTALSRLERFAAAHAVIVSNLRDWSAGVSGGGSGPSGKGTISDPTGNGAMLTDNWARLRSEMDALIDRVFAASCDLEHIRRQVAAPALPSEPEERGLARCCNPNCPDDAWAVKAGRCDACYQFKRRHDRDRRKSLPPMDA